MPFSRPDSPSEAALLAQVDWIRRLARVLVADRDLAEDLVQETCAAYLERAAERPAKLRPWLARVLHNALRQHQRAASRRRRREELRARSEAVEGDEAVLERVLLQRRLVDAVVSLSEPYRSAVLLRFFEDLPPREIARRAAVPVATVHSRLQRALAQLRGRLDRESDAWAVLLWPWVQRPDFLTASLLPTLMNAKLSVALSSAVLALLACLWWTRSKTQEEPAAVRVAAEAAELRAPFSAAAGEFAPPDEPAAREPVVPAPGRASASAQESAPLPAAWTVRVRVLGAEGEPLAGIPLCASGSPLVLGTSASGGWCEIETRAEHLALASADPAWVTVRDGAPVRGSTHPAVVVVARALDLGGCVHDGEGRALRGAEVRYELPEGFDTRFEDVLESSRARRWLESADGDGRFAFAGLPAIAGARLRAVRAGYEREELAAPLESRGDLELVLFRPRAPLAGVLRGHVLERSGVPVVGARVGLGLASCESDEDGEFALQLAQAVSAETLSAVKAGYQPAFLERPGEPQGEASGWPDDVTLVLGAPPLTLAGHVLDTDGQPVAGAKLWLHDPTPAAPIGRLLTQLETLSAGVEVPPEALNQEAERPARDGNLSWTEDDVAGAPSAAWYWVASDASGAFELGGLVDRRYRLDLLAPGSLAVETSDSFSAGARDALVRLGAPDVFASVEGRVLDERGLALAEVQLFLMIAVIDTSGRVFGGTQRSILYERGGFASTDAEGRFQFHDVPKHGAHLLLRGEQSVPSTVELAEAAPTITLESRASLELVLREPRERYDRFELADGAGQTVPILFLTHGSADARSSAPLVDGRSGVVSASLRAREVRFYKAGLRLDTQPLALVPGQVNRFEF